MIVHSWYIIFEGENIKTNIKGADKIVTYDFDVFDLAKTNISIEINILKSGNVAIKSNNLCLISFILFITTSYKLFISSFQGSMTVWSS